MPEAQRPVASAGRVSTHVTLSVVIITRNEEARIARCLERLTFATEIIVADTGSTDQTVNMARKYTPHVQEVPWQGFGATKQAALEMTTGQWVLSIDADEVVDETLALAISAAVRANDPNVAGYRLNRKSNFLGTWMRHSGWYPDWVVRLARRDRMRFSSHRVHEKLEVDGPVGLLPGHLLHYTDPDFDHYLAKLARYSRLSAVSLHEEGRSAHIGDLLVRPFYQFVRTFVIQLGFLDGRAGLILACGSAFHVFSKYAHLWCLGQGYTGVDPDH